MSLCNESKLLLDKNGG